MHKIRHTVLLLLLAPLAAGCDALLGDDPTPETIRYQLQGEAGAEVQVIVSKNFIAGTTETGVTQVEVFGSDTLTTTLPLDREMDISLEQRFYMQVFPVDSVDIPDARVIVTIDGNERFNESGVLPADPPFRYAYIFNQRVTRIIEVF